MRQRGERGIHTCTCTVMWKNRLQNIVFTLVRVGHKNRAKLLN